MAKKETLGNYAVPGITGTATSQPTTSPTAAVSTGSTSKSTSSKTNSSSKSSGSSGSSGSGVSSAVLSAQIKAEQDAARLAQGRAALDQLGSFNGNYSLPAYQSPLTAEDYFRASTPKTPDYSLNYTPTPAGLAYQNAMEVITKDLKTGKPVYQNKWDSELENSYNSIVNRAAFEYDADTDPLWQQYYQRYTDLGQRAMRDTIAQTAALTGGYSNTYSQYAGQEAYNAYVSALADKALELEDRAYQRYQDEGNRLYQNFQMAGAMSDTTYGRWRDQVSDYNQALALAQAYEAENYQRAVQEHEYDILAEQTGYNRGRDALSDLRYEDELAYGRYRDYAGDVQKQQQFDYQIYSDKVNSILKLYS